MGATVNVASILRTTEYEKMSSASLSKNLDL